MFSFNKLALSFCLRKWFSVFFLSCDFELSLSPSFPLPSSLSVSLKFVQKKFKTNFFYNKNKMIPPPIRPLPFTLFLSPSLSLSAHPFQFLTLYLVCSLNSDKFWNYLITSWFTLTLDFDWNLLILFYLYLYFSRFPPPCLSPLCRYCWWSTHTHSSKHIGTKERGKKYTTHAVIEFHVKAQKIKNRKRKKNRKNRKKIEIQFWCWQSICECPCSRKS